MIDLEQIRESNLSHYKMYEHIYEGELKQYQSRIYPNHNSEELCWYYIKADGQYVGSIWLEKMSGAEYAVLGIFIADEEYRNKGIGTASIRWIIENGLRGLNVDKIHLHVRAENQRAISCYKKIGFREVNRFQKSEINVIEMRYSQEK